jgi:hypothetical protein
MSTPVPAKDELIEVSPKVWFVDALVPAHGLALEVRKDAMDPGQ